jgi:hypothetical protein
VTCINPFTATAAARLISNEIQHEVRTQTHSVFITATDLNAWKYLLGRHFGSMNLNIGFHSQRYDHRTRCWTS